MGKKNIKRESGDSQYSTSTVFVSNLPFSFTNTQLEETFSDVGPIRRCFLVTKKGTAEHRGIGFVQFANVEDANSAIELKNESRVGGRKIGVKHAMHRVPLEQRKLKGSQVNANKKDPQERDRNESLPDEAVKAELDLNSQEAGSQTCSNNPRRKRKASVLWKGMLDEKSGSEKQRVARTVIIGGILSADMAEEVHSLAKGCGTVCSVTYPLPKEELEYNGLAQDGCTVNASSVLYTRVKSAQTSVATLHQREIQGRTIWVRQLGGQGSKTNKWKLIVRNIPFQTKVSELKTMFSTAGFVWDVNIPLNVETGLSKGFAFVKFTSKQDAEKAIMTFNGKTFGGRPIAIDWAVPKKVYVADSQPAATLEDGKIEGQNESDEGDNISVDLEGKEIEIDAKSQQDLSNGIEEEEEEEVDGEGEDTQPQVNIDMEADVARKVLENLMTSTSKGMAASSADDDSSSLLDGEKSEVIIPESCSKEKNTMWTEGVEDLNRTIFINNLPFDVDNEEVKQRFSAFGEVESFVQVLHQVTKRPRGTGFLKFKTVDAAEASLSAANSSGLGIPLKGRQLKVFKAVDKKTAQDKELEKTKKEEHDHRNLYLAKEGLVLEGTPAAEGVSAGDMSKRKILHEKKMIKLKSPNFHVSRTRLIIYNLPKSMTDKELKKLCLDAVTSRATKQKPMIRQIKFLEDTKKGKLVVKNHSRGVAFVEFTEHQHALVALRVLNNNPGTFGPEHRPIVEFSIDNVHTLLRHKERNQDQSTGFHHKMEKINVDPNGSKRKTENSRESEKSRKCKSNGEKEANTEPARTAKKQKQKKVSIGSKEEKLKENNGKGKLTDVRSQQMKSARTNKSIHIEAGTHRSKGRLNDETLLEKQSNTSGVGKKRKKNADPVGQDVMDKLDVLIDQYRSKFTKGNFDQKSGNKKQLKRWFQL
ncbi:unnamed protein product [Cuscuta epithymum]|uniref:RRM domain-containing protein n=1 Tax=Cuscuta epithymum TaxID=186058 RepID=A0AAV0GHJ2_9ASTE|nr:unnamed protein product [Cuscuta epithymum]CAH9147029.1 unnamed protein product [Cuscuta epithymum]